MPTNCPQHPDQPATLVVDAAIPNLRFGGLDRELALACTNTCAADLRASYLLAGAHPDHIDTYPATPDLIGDITGDEVAA